MKKSIFVFILMIFTTSLKSDPLFIDNFNYAVRDTLAGVGAWFKSSVPPYPKVIAPGLTYTGYKGSGIGPCVYLSIGNNTGISTNYYGEENSGTVYLSVLVRVDSMSVISSEGFIMTLDQAGGTTNFNSYIYLKKITGSTFKFGLRKYDMNPVFTAANYNTNTTYLIVVSYTFKPGSSTNDVSKMNVFSSGIPATEPAVPLLLDSTGNDVNNIGDVAIANGFNQNGLKNTSVKIDGLRIGKTWNATLFEDFNCNLNLTALIQGFYNGTTNKMVKDTVSLSLRYDRPPYSVAETRKAVLDSNGSGLFTFKTINNFSTYYLVANHRNMLESWSRFRQEFQNNTLSYNFSGGSGSTYGNNVIQKGSRYCFYNGEIDHDGIIDVTDYQFVDNNSFLFATGYKTTDLNGDNFTDLSDLSIVEQNSFNFVQVMKP